jgi:hypothetical protein
MEPKMTGSDYRELGRKMSKSDATDSNPIIITDAIKISALQSEVKYWKGKYEWLDKFTSHNVIGVDLPN